MSNEPGHVAKSSTYGADADEVAIEVIRQAKLGSVNELGIIEWCRLLATEHKVLQVQFLGL